MKKTKGLDYLSYAKRERQVILFRLEKFQEGSYLCVWIPDWKGGSKDTSKFLSMVRGTLLQWEDKRQCVQTEIQEIMLKHREKLHYSERRSNKGRGWPKILWRHSNNCWTASWPNCWPCSEQVVALYSLKRWLLASVVKWILRLVWPLFMLGKKRSKSKASSCYFKRKIINWKVSDFNLERNYSGYIYHWTAWSSGWQAYT